MKDPFFQIKDLHTGYGEIQVLWGVDIDIHEKEIVCIVGSNGAGKSTLLRCISGLISSYSGKIEFQGKDLTNCPPHQVLGAGIAHVPEGRRLFPAMSVKNNLLMGAYLRRDKNIETDLEFVFSLFPVLAERINQDAGTLSGGEQQMCAIARGIMSRPALLIIDELSLGLAPMVVDTLSDSLLNINKTGVSILLVEQDVGVAIDLSERLFVIEAGRTAVSGFAKDLAKDPAIREAYMGLS
jgi:branched-chain amino acid transport system ATP-binding protein